jgi:6,7-dimethyl-8-ribityllumazine synthase
MSIWRSKYPQANESYKVAIVAAEFNDHYVEALVENCIRGLKRCGVDEDSIDLFQVPGSFEIPLVAKKAAASLRYDSVITLGVIVKGDTYHFQLVADSAAHGVQKVMLETGIPVIFGVLACDTNEQVEARLELGDEFARAAVKMMNIEV